MSDPYNSWRDHVPTASPVAATPVTATPAARRMPHDPIARLDVSERWKRRFRLIEKAGGSTLPHFRELPFGERLGLNFNGLAFFLGPFYFLAKGLWRPAVLYLLVAIVLGVLLEASGHGRLSQGVGGGLAAFFASRANINYYKKVVLGETPWL